jgi:nicotinamidase-related amidase
MTIGIPHPDKKRALIIVDVQSSFINSENESVVPMIARIVKGGGYSAVVEATFSSDGNPLWEKQTHWTCEPADTVPEIKNLLPTDDSKLYVHKSSKSAWKGDADIKSFFQNKGIEEVHVVGLDTNDCVLATAYESFDLGFQTYVIEEATHASQGANMRAAAIDILRKLDLTNRSEYIEDFMFV